MGWAGRTCAGGKPFCQEAAPHPHHPCTPWVKPSAGRSSLKWVKNRGVVVLRGGRSVNLHLCRGCSWLWLVLGFILAWSPGGCRARGGENAGMAAPARPPRYWEYFCGCRCGYITAHSFLVSILVQNSNNSPPSPIAAVHGGVFFFFLSRSLTLREEQ